MREVFLAETAGFCFGVKRAVDTVYNEISNPGNEKVYTYGPIIHNEEVVGDLKSKGVTILDEDIFEHVEDGSLSYMARPTP